MRSRICRRAFLAFVSTRLIALASADGTTPRIEDNSFLIEEAYNQETGIYQHIQYLRLNRDKDWEYNFTEEIPLGGFQHQLSFGLTIRGMPGVAGGPSTSGLADTLLNYRYGLVNQDQLKVAPRLSLILPTGDSARGLGDGALGYQFNLPVTIVVAEEWMMHWNLGSTFVPAAKNAAGEKAGTLGFNYGASVIATHSRTFNWMLEVVGSSDESVVGEGATQREDTFYLNPGFRFAINYESGLQVVPGLSMPIGLGPSARDYGAFFYLSIEK